MEDEPRAYMEALDTLWGQVSGEIEAMPLQALNWRPLQQESNTAAVLVTHMCGVVSLIVYQALTGVDVHRQRPREFQATADTPQELVSLISRTEELVREALEAATPASLGATVSLPDRDPMTGRSYLLQALAHLGEHLGHLQMTRQLWEART